MKECYLCGCDIRIGFICFPCEAAIHHRAGVSLIYAPVLAFLVSGYSGYGYGYTPFAPICEATGLDRKMVRLACRSLKRKGLAHYQRGLWTDNGEPAGAGYAATQAGVDLLSAITAEGGKE